MCLYVNECMYVFLYIYGHTYSNIYAYGACSFYFVHLHFFISFIQKCKKFKLWCCYAYKFEIIDKKNCNIIRSRSELKNKHNAD